METEKHGAATVRTEQLELLSLAGAVGSKDAKPSIHARAVFISHDATDHRGQPLESHLRSTRDLVETETPLYL